jgi:lysophospholipase L1-like esterase
LFRTERLLTVRRVVKQACFSLIPVIVILGMGELSFRIISPAWMACVRTRACPRPDPEPRFVTEQKSNFSLEAHEPLLVYHPQLFWWPRPHVKGTFWSTPGVQTNEFGLREKSVEISTEKCNVLLVGDSVVWGSLVQTEERFSNMAQELLSKLPGYKHVQIINAGVVGFSSFQVLQYLRTRGLERFQPSVVVVCAGINDSWRVAMSDGEEFERNNRPGPRIRYLLQGSNLFLFFERYTHEFLTWVNTGENPEGIAFLYSDVRKSPTVLRNTPERTERNMKSIGKMVGDQDGIPVFVLEETRIQHPHAWNAESFREGRTRVKHLAQTNGWPMIEIAALGGEPWHLDRTEYLLDFCHLHPRGHRIIAELLVEELVSLIPRVERLNESAP